VGYRLKPTGFYLPYFELVEQRPEGKPYPGLTRIELTPGDLRLFDRATKRLADLEPFPLAAAARSVRRKLAFDLPISESGIARALALPLSDEARRSLEVLQRAVGRRRAVRCRYVEEERDLEPWGLFFQRGHWYCVARPRDRRETRVFRVDRVSAARDLAGEDAGFDVPATFDVRVYLGRMPWALGDGPATPVRLRLRFPESRWVLNERLGTPVTPLLEDGGAVVEFEVRERPPFLRWVLSFGGRAEVVAPADVATELDGLRREVARIYDR
jgi:predicted DNA-binding transcriptional regulator YafY